MTMQNRISIALGFLLVMTVSACSSGGAYIDDDDNGGHVNNPLDVTPPVVTINAPTPDQVFSNGSNIVMSGNISDDLGLYRGTVKITNDNTGIVVKEQAYEIHGLVSYNFNVSYTANVTTLTNYTVAVSFEDHGYNSASKTVKIKVNP